MTTFFYLQHAAYAGQKSTWAHGFFPERPLLLPLAKYNMRRLDEMSVYAVEATLRALAERGIEPEAYGRYGVLSLSHNGPSRYSEEFFEQVLTEENPQQASPMLFTESVLNIAASHIALALKTHQPILAFNAGLEDYFEVVCQAAMLLQSGHMERVVFCSAEEFSPVCTEVLAACPAYPGKTFCGGAVAFLASGKPLPGDNVRVTISPKYTPETTRTILQHPAEENAEQILSAFSELQPESVGDIAALRHSPVESFMEREQGFTVLRAAEWAWCARRVLETNQSVMLVQADRETLQVARFSPVDH